MGGRVDGIVDDRIVAIALAGSLLVVSDVLVNNMGWGALSQERLVFLVG
jgi:hypothetical protein